MAIQYKSFTIPIHGSEAVEAELNLFLRTVKVVQVEHQFVEQKEFSFWVLMVEYMTGEITPEPFGSNGKIKSRVDYKQVLAPEDFAIYARLREWRKEKAGEEGVPVYTIFSNEQLAKIAEKRLQTLAALNEIEGIGKGRISKYGDEVLAALETACRNIEQGKGE